MSATETQSPETDPAPLADRIGALVQLWREREGRYDEEVYTDNAVRSAVCACRKELQKTLSAWAAGMEGRAE